jgi:ribose transport system ATP-binding protein
VNLRV